MNAIPTRTATGLRATALVLEHVRLPQRRVSRAAPAATIARIEGA